ncbi:MAG: hypothetical protein AAF889_11205, partial [Cyanobacteria bacterium P01_D01_bin.73]
KNPGSRVRRRLALPFSPQAAENFSDAPPRKIPQRFSGFVSGHRLVTVSSEDGRQFSVAAVNRLPQ